MKRYYAVLVSVVVTVLILSLTVYGDSGPKPSVTIEAVNMPDELCYMDLLVTDDNSNFHGNYDNLNTDRSYNASMIEALKNSGIDGWHPGMVVGTMRPMSGDILCNDYDNDGTVNMTYSYVGVPDEFRVIVVTISGKTIVSNTVWKSEFQSVVDFDYETGIAGEQNLFISYLWQFVNTFTPTVLLELLVMLIFGFSIRKNIWVFLTANLITQVMLTLLVAVRMMSAGTWAAMVSYVLFEIVIIAVETGIYYKYLKEHTPFRRIFYGLVSNGVSFIAGLYMLVNVRW